MGMCCNNRGFFNEEIFWIIIIIAVILIWVHSRHRGFLGEEFRGCCHDGL